MNMRNEKRSSVDRTCNDVDLSAIVPDNVQRVLHLGCSDGKLGRRLLESRAKEVVGVDNYGPAIDLARRNITEVICGSIEGTDLPYDKGYFDFVIIESTLEYQKDPLNALHKIKRYLYQE